MRSLESGETGYGLGCALTHVDFLHMGTVIRLRVCFPTGIFGIIVPTINSVGAIVRFTINALAIKFPVGTDLGEEDG